MTNLQEKCLQTLTESLVQSILKTPPIITDLIATQLIQELEKKISFQLRAIIRDEVISEIADAYATSIPNITTDIVKSIINNKQSLKFLKKFNNINPVILQSCIETAHILARSCILLRMEEGIDDGWGGYSMSDSE